MTPSSRNVTNAKVAPGRTLVACGSALTLIYVWICWLSFSFHQEIPGVDRPMIPVLALFGCSIPIYALAWRTVGGFSSPESTGRLCSARSLVTVIGFGLVFRAVMAPSIPIQEIDIYRYIWDGGVVTTGIDPYLYSPKTVLEALDRKNTPSDTIMTESPRPDSPHMQRVLDLLDRRPGLRNSLLTTHFNQYTTPYPPVSQWVFGTAVAMVPVQSGPQVYLYTMKATLLLLDVGTGLIIVVLLGHLGYSRLLSLGYWWCPLVIKEIANSGHLDSIVIFFTTLAIYFFARAMWPRHETKTGGDNGLYFNGLFAVGGAIFLGISIAAKIVPIVLIPILIIALLRRRFLATIGLLLLLVGTTAILMWPMARHFESTKRLSSAYEWKLPFSETLSDEIQGMEAFSRHWEMNDLIFMVLVENLNPASEDATSGDRPWFAVTSNKFRKRFCGTESAEDSERGSASLAPPRPSFSIARTVTLAVFGLCVMGFCVSVFRNTSAENWMEKAFLTIAWFWLLAPTQNPWYWIWALPLLPFAKGRAWFWISGLLFLYYLRFWLGYHFTGVPLLGTPYSGTTFFDFVIPWIEFGPWLGVLFLCWSYRSARGLNRSSFRSPP